MDPHPTDKTRGRRRRSDEASATVPLFLISVFAVSRSRVTLFSTRCFVKFPKGFVNFVRLKKAPTLLNR
ncbi:hypothetical protein HanPI659440_Chr09g0356161 [Helianthus annuus]|nr:hypothetical protein HanPI659440_Chr09g0356161 [Helianthus annuus]